MEEAAPTGVRPEGPEVEVTDYPRDTLRPAEEGWGPPFLQTLSPAGTTKTAETSSPAGRLQESPPPRAVTQPSASGNRRRLIFDSWRSKPRRTSVPPSRSRACGYPRRLFRGLGRGIGGCIRPALSVRCCGGSVKRHGDRLWGERQRRRIRWCSPIEGKAAVRKNGRFSRDAPTCWKLEALLLTTFGGFGTVQLGLL